MFTRIIAAGLAVAALSATVPAAAQSSEDQRFQAAQAQYDRAYQTYRQAVDRYTASRRSYPGQGYDRGGYQGGYQQPGYAPPPPPPGAYSEENYDAARDYRDGSYRERTLGNDDRVYAGSDGRYYCKRSDGTTGLIVGGVAGGLFGNLVSGRSSTLGTLLGAGGGALVGRAVDQNSSQVRCR